MRPLSVSFISLLLLSACNGDENKMVGQHTPHTGDTVTVSVKEGQHKVYDPADHLDFGGLQNYFSSPRVDEWVNNKPLFADEDEMDHVHDYLDSSEMAQLNVEALIYYCTKYPASFSQICADSWDPDSTENPKITAHFYFDYSGETMSDLQEQAVADRIDSVVIKLKEYLKNTPGELDEKALVLLYQLDPVESIPVVLETLSDRHLVNYTYLMLVMADHHYVPFISTGIYKKLYGEESWHFSKIDATSQNRDLIAILAGDFYKSKKAQ